MIEALVQEFNTQKRWHLADTDIGRDVITEVIEKYGLDLADASDVPIDVIALLAEAEADWEMAVIAVLRGVRSIAEPNIERIGKRLGASIRQLYESALQLDSISLAVESGNIKSRSSSRKIDLSRILVAMVDDPRVVVIHLAELLVKMRNAKNLCYRSQQLVKYYPTAMRSHTTGGWTRRIVSRCALYLVPQLSAHPLAPLSLSLIHISEPTRPY